MATAYQWIKRGTNGGGRGNCGEADPLNPGRACVMGDVWGAHATDDFGDNWYSVQWGVNPSAGKVAGNGYGRACMFSKRPGTSGAVYVGTGTLAGTASGGQLAVVTKGSYQQLFIDNAHGFGTNYATPPAGNYPRPVGNAIVVDYDSGADIEYVFSYTPAGLYVYQNGGGSNILAAQTGTNLATATAVSGTTYKSACMGYDAQHMFLTSYAYNISDAPVASTVYLLSTSSSRLGTATAGTVTITNISSHVPGTGRVNWLEHANSVVYAACDDGIYLVNSTGTTWTSLGFPTNGGKPTCVRYSSSSGNLYVFCGQDASGNFRFVAKGVGSGTSWTWTWLLTGTASNWSDTEFGTGNQWWLPTHGMNSTFYGCNAGAVTSNGGSDYLYAIGFGGIQMSRDSGAHWQPAPNGAGGGECLGVLAGSGGNVTYQDHDWGTGQTSDHFVHFAAGGTATSNTGLTVTKNGHTFAVGAGTTPATATLDGNNVADDVFRGAVVSPNAVDISSESPPYLYVGVVGGGIITGVPITAPVAPSQGTPTLSSDTPVEGTSISVQDNVSTWGGSPTPTFTHQWQTAPSAISSFTNITGATGSSYTPVTGDIGNVIKCVVTAKNTAGQAIASTEVSSPVASSAGSGDTTPPTAPTGVALTIISYQEIDVTWTGSTDSGGSGLGGYIVKRIQGTSTVTAGSVGPTTTSFNDLGLQPNTQYSYIITAFDNAQNSTDSTQTAIVTTPTRPVGGDQTVTITQPTQNQVFTQQQQSLEAIVVPGSFPIAKVTATINAGVELQLTQDTQTTNGWLKTIALAAGQNTIVVRAYDNTGAIVSAQVQVSFSSTNVGPTITILNPSPDGEVLTSNTVVVQADIEDSDGIDPTTVQVSTDGINWINMTPPSNLTGGG